MLRASWCACVVLLAANLACGADPRVPPELGEEGLGGQNGGRGIMAGSAGVPSDGGDRSQEMSGGGFSGAGSSGRSGDASAPRERRSLVDHELWQVVDGSEDPFDDRLETFLCANNAHYVTPVGEDTGFEIETVRCNYLTVVQPILAEVEPGDRIAVKIWRFELTTSESAEAHIAIAFDDGIAWDERVPIPSGSDMMTPSWVSPVGYPAGTPVYFHLHNHGANSWTLVELSTGP
jgi:hypothetical protein